MEKPWICPYCKRTYAYERWFRKHLENCRKAHNPAIPVFYAKIGKKKEYFEVFLDRVFEELKIQIRLKWSDHKGKFLALKYFSMAKGKEALKAVNQCVTVSFNKLFPSKINGVK